jgi:RimJ/RimL family protein N-acetyltransferase
VFSPVVTAFWDTAFSGQSAGTRRFALVVNADLNEDRRVMILTSGDTVRAVMTPAVARMVGVSTDGASGPFTESDLRQALRHAGVALHGADRLHYFLETDRDTLLREAVGVDVRHLTLGDAAAFTEFETIAPAQDRDDAYVELDHWAVFGAFVRDRLVSVASAYPWGGAQIADIGVLTLPEFRGRGHARAVVRALCRHAATQGYEPQYRCQLDNEPSIAVAKTAGLTFFGTWEVVSQD